MKFGDIVLNEYAGKKNPEKVMMYYKREWNDLLFLSLNGNVLKFDKTCDGLKVIGKIDFKEWKKLAENFS